jgi:putative NADH-flavin reductase
MRLIVLGASGGCGKALVAQAVERGHAVTAVVREGSAHHVPAGATVKTGSLTDAAFLASAFSGHDVVLSSLGIKLKSIAPWAKPEQADFLTRCTPVIISAMQSAGVRRICAISAGGVGDSNAMVPGFFRALIRFSALGKAYGELEVMERLLLASGLEVCLPRPTGLTDGPLAGGVRVVTQLRGRATISRADVASWMLDQLQTPGFEYRSPMITVTG